MIFGKAIVWTVRMLLISLFLAFLFVIQTGFSENVSSTHQLQFQKTFFDVMPRVVSGGVVDDIYFSEVYLEELLGDQSKIGFLLQLQKNGETIKEVYYKKEYYSSRVFLTTGGNYYEYSGRFPVTYENEEVDLYYSYVVAK